MVISVTSEYYINCKSLYYKHAKDVCEHKIMVDIHSIFLLKLKDVEPIERCRISLVITILNNESIDVFICSTTTSERSVRGTSAMTSQMWRNF